MTSAVPAQLEYLVIDGLRLRAHVAGDEQQAEAVFPFITAKPAAQLLMSLLALKKGCLIFQYAQRLLQSLNLCVAASDTFRIRLCLGNALLLNLRKYFMRASSST